MELTENGLDNLDEIIRLIFHYIRLIHSKGVTREKYNDFTKISSLQFRFMERKEPLEEVSRLAEELRNYDNKHILSGDIVFQRYDPRLIESFL